MVSVLLVLEPKSAQCVGYAMKIPKYLSPSALSCFEYSQSEYYLKYCAQDRPPRKPQTRPMSIGSAFDAYVKAHIAEKFFGEVREDLAFEYLFETQVEEQHRDWAREHGQWVFDCYLKSGALADLMCELDLAIEEPRFEVKVEGTVSHEDEIEGMVLLGKPDLYFKTEHAHLIHDWKVNGYCSKSGVSPKPGYIKVRDGWDLNYSKPSRNRNNMHKDCQPMMVDGIQINVGKFFEDVDKKWADQLTTYGWVLGEPVGAPLVIGIEQLACKPGPDKPLVRVASHRGYVSPKYQKNLFSRYARVWKAITKGHIFDEDTYEESIIKQQTLDNQHKAYNDDTENDKWFTKMMRKH